MAWSASFLFAVLLSARLETQDAHPVVTTRAAQIQAERAGKEAAGASEEPPRTEGFFKRITGKIPKLSRMGPFRLQPAGVTDSSGFAIGSRLTWETGTNTTRVNASATGTTRGFYALRAGVLFPDFASRQLRVGIDASHSDSPKLDYYGPGPDSSKGSRTNYRREDTSLDFHVSWHPVRRHLTAEFEIGPYLVNVGPGRDPRFASAETVYTPGEAPGIDLQTNFLRTVNSVDLDFRDMPRDPHDGSRLVLRYLHYTDLHDGPYSFSRVSATAEHYIGFLNKKRTVGLRAVTDLTLHGPNQVVPFYLQPTLGGPDDLRGFRLYRFNGNNLVSFNGEYRWEISTGFDTALFADAGQVFDRARQISFSRLETSAGFGFRFKLQDRVVMRIDTGFSREGFQTWVRFNTGL